MSNFIGSVLFMIAFLIFMCACDLSDIKKSLRKMSGRDT